MGGQFHFYQDLILIGHFVSRYFTYLLHGLGLIALQLHALETLEDSFDKFCEFFSLKIGTAKISSLQLLALQCDVFFVILLFECMHVSNFSNLLT